MAVLHCVEAMDIAGNSTQGVQTVDCHKESVSSRVVSDSSDLSYLSNETGLAMPRPQTPDEMNLTLDEMINALRSVVIACIIETDSVHLDSRE